MLLVEFAGAALVALVAEFAGFADFEVAVAVELAKIVGRAAANQFAEHRAFGVPDCSHLG